MRSSDVDEPREADMADQMRLADALSQEEVEALIPHESIWKYRVRRLDIPVQILRIAILFGIWALWHYEVVWNGWEALSLAGIQPFPNVPETFRASPGETWQYFTEIYHEKLFWQDLWVTVKEALFGFVIGSVLGLLVGIVLGRFRRASKAVGPFIVIINAMPKIAFLPLILIVYGVGGILQGRLGRGHRLLHRAGSYPGRGRASRSRLGHGGSHHGRVPATAFHQGHAARHHPSGVRSAAVVGGHLGAGGGVRRDLLGPPGPRSAAHHRGQPAVLRRHVRHRVHPGPDRADHERGDRLRRTQVPALADLPPGRARSSRYRWLLPPSVRCCRGPIRRGAERRRSRAFRSRRGLACRGR